MRPLEACLTHRLPPEHRPWRRADDGYRTCAGCYDVMHAWLSPLSVDADGRPDSIPAMYARLNPRPGPATDSGGIRAPGFGARSPANDHVIAMRDARSGAALRPGDPRSAPAILRAWVLYVWDERYDDDALNQPDYQWHRRSLPRDVIGCARYLDGNLDWLTRQPIITEFCAELRSLRAQLRSIGSPRRRVGECPNTIDEGPSTRECGAPLYAPLHGDEIRCGACGRPWPREEWLSLGDLVDS